MNVIGGEGDTTFDDILDPKIMHSKGCGEVLNGELWRHTRIHTCGRCGQTSHHRRSYTNTPQNVVVIGQDIIAQQQTKNVYDMRKDINYQMILCIKLPFQYPRVSQLTCLTSTFYFFSHELVGVVYRAS